MYFALLGMGPTADGEISRSEIQPLFECRFCTLTFDCVYVRRLSTFEGRTGEGADKFKVRPENTAKNTSSSCISLYLQGRLKKEKRTLDPLTRFNQNNGSGFDAAKNIKIQGPKYILRRANLRFLSTNEVCSASGSTDSRRQWVAWELGGAMTSVGD